MASLSGSRRARVRLHYGADSTLMPPDWSREEIEAVVADYFDMFEERLRGVKLNKTAHRRRLSALLNCRTDSSIEFKHQNISAVLVDLGAFPLDGYRPLFNYQHSLAECVADRLGRSQGLESLIRQQASAPAAVPEVADILAAWVEPPSPDPGRSRFREASAQEPTILRRVDYAAIEARNRSLGSAGEEFVRRFEIARLMLAGKGHLARNVERVSESRGDGLGFDVRSFEVSGEDRLIEVKTTQHGAFTPFFVTINEVRVSQREGSRYHLYRAFDFGRKPRLFSRQGPLEQGFRLDPSEYIATVV
jgi:hypothetical protein